MVYAQDIERLEKASIIIYIDPQLSSNSPFIFPYRRMDMQVDRFHHFLYSIP
jgi:hypothetical protein